MCLILYYVVLICYLIELKYFIQARLFHIELKSLGFIPCECVMYEVETLNELKELDSNLTYLIFVSYRITRYLGAHSGGSLG